MVALLKRAERLAEKERSVEMLGGVVEHRLDTFECIQKVMRVVNRANTRWVAAERLCPIVRFFTGDMLSTVRQMCPTIMPATVAFACAHLRQLGCIATF